MSSSRDTKQVQHTTQTLLSLPPVSPILPHGHGQAATSNFPYTQHAQTQSQPPYGPLEHLLSTTTSIHPPTNVLAYLSDGRRVTSGNLRELAPRLGEDGKMWVFDKRFLDLELEEIHEIVQQEGGGVELWHDKSRYLQPPPPALHPSTNTTSTSQASLSSQESSSSSILRDAFHTYLTTTHTHLASLIPLLHLIQSQHTSLTVASTSLDLNILALTDTFDSLAPGMERQIREQGALVEGVEGDLEVLKWVKVDRWFLRLNQKDKEGKEPVKERTLAEYVSGVKMRQVREACRKVNDELHTRFVGIQASVREVVEAAGLVRFCVKGVAAPAPPPAQDSGGTAAEGSSHANTTAPSHPESQMEPEVEGQLPDEGSMVSIVRQAEECVRRVDEWAKRLEAIVAPFLNLGSDTTGNANVNTGGAGGEAAMSTLTEEVVRDVVWLEQSVRDEVGRMVDLKVRLLRPAPLLPYPFHFTLPPSSPYFFSFFTFSLNSRRDDYPYLNIHSSPSP
jgi:hypothetical protein